MTSQPAQTFYEQTAANRRRSWLLVLVVALVLGALGFAIGFGSSGELAGGYVAIAIALAVALILSAGSYFAGDSLVLAASRARQVDEGKAPQLMNVVREMSISANVPMPRVYVIDDPALNAFATGRDARHASVAVTSGLLERLNREELQGVIGHEMSHVRNLDIRFTLLVGVLVGSIVLLADFFLRWTWWGGGPRSSGGRRGGGGSGGGGGAIIVIYVIAIVLAILAPILATLIQMAVSRQREYLADASSVELTRNPYGLQKALAKIGLDPQQLSVANRATQHLYFVNPLRKLDVKASSLMSTHPPIIERINRLRALTGDPPLENVEGQALAGTE